jgi:hypothetical protein
MKKIGKIILIILGVLFVALLTAEWFIEMRLESLINANPNRKYNIVYSNLDLNTFLNGITIDKMEMIPMEQADSGKTKIIGKMDYAEITGFRPMQFLFSKIVSVNSMSFIEPDFNIYIRSDSTSKSEGGNNNGGSNIQELFADVLTRVNLENFELRNGRASVTRVQDSLVIGKVDRINIIATGIETDSIQMNHLIPFEIKSIDSEISGIRSELIKNTRIDVGTIRFEHEKSFFSISDVSMKFTKDWQVVSQEMGKQTDLIQLDLKTLEIHNLAAKSSFYGSMDVEASMIRIDSLTLTDARDKNQPRPTDVVKPMFTGMVNQIPFPINVDSIVIENSSISYTELPEGKTEPGTLTFAEINGVIRDISNLEGIQDSLVNLTAQVSSKLNGQAPLTLNLTVPYSHDGFIADATISGLDVTSLNPTIIPLASVKAESGMIDHFNLIMTADETSANNTLTLDYSNLEVAVLTPDDNNKNKKAGLLSGVAKSALKHSNQPDGNNYIRPDYTSTRNLYRSPFNFMWSTIKEGMIIIVPSNTAGIFLPKKGKQERKKGTKNN